MGTHTMFGFEPTFAGDKPLYMFMPGGTSDGEPLTPNSGEGVEEAGSAEKFEVKLQHLLTNQIYHCEHR